MSSVVCQGLKSCLEPRLDEPCVSRHKISPTLSVPSQPLEEIREKDYSRNEDNNNGCGDTDLKSVEKCNKGGWNFIEALVNPSHSTKVADKNEEVYVHPLVKRSSSALSSKGLEMCTEGLGCETGSDTSSDEISSFSWERERMLLLSTDEHSSLYKEKSQQLDEFSSPPSNKNKSSYRKFTKLNTVKCSFPPPLASISGSNGVEVRPRREGGRLIINAVAVSSCRTYFKADRTNGRLRLSLQRECSVDCSCEMNKKDKVVYDNEDEEEEEVLEHENVSELSDNEDCWDETEENNQQVGHEFGIGEFPRPSRCKEGGRGRRKEMSNWGPLWVAIS